MQFKKQLEDDNDDDDDDGDDDDGKNALHLICANKYDLKM